MFCQVGMRMFLMKRKSIKKNIPWYRDLWLYKGEIIVAKECIECGELIGTNDINKKYHKECLKKIRRKKYRSFNPVQINHELDKYREITVGARCIVCNKFFPCSRSSARYCIEHEQYIKHKNIQV